jgi:hypothetical protein
MSQVRRVERPERGVRPQRSWKPPQRKRLAGVASQTGNGGKPLADREGPGTDIDAATYGPS